MGGGVGGWAGVLIITNSAPQLSPQILPVSYPCLSQSQASGRREEGGDSWWRGGGLGIKGQIVSTLVQLMRRDCF